MTISQPRTSTRQFDIEKRPPVNGKFYVAEEFCGGNDWLNRAAAQKLADQWNEALRQKRKLR